MNKYVEKILSLFVLGILGTFGMSFSSQTIDYLLAFFLIGYPEYLGFAVLFAFLSCLCWYGFVKLIRRLM